VQRLQPGYALAERYWLVSRIAVGGMGEVWEAGDATLQRRIAIKVLKPRHHDDEIFHKRFRDEALHAAGLIHPNISTVFDYGHHDDLPYIAMELVEGESLAERLKNGPMAPDEVRAVVVQAALALQAAHEADVVHRDIKPANLMITADGLIKLTDFGISRALYGLMHTLTGELLGTPYYISPEQARGASATSASDIYSLGVVAHELLTGKRPFVGPTPVDTAQSHVEDPPPPLPDDVPEDLRRVIEACLSKDPAERPKSGREIAEALGLTGLFWSPELSKQSGA